MDGRGLCIQSYLTGPSAVVLQLLNQKASAYGRKQRMKQMIKLAIKDSTLYATAPICTYSKLQYTSTGKGRKYEASLYKRNDQAIDRSLNSQ